MKSGKKKLLAVIVASVAALALLAVFGVNWWADRESQLEFDRALTAAEAAKQHFDDAEAEASQVALRAAAVLEQGNALHDMTGTLLLSDPAVKETLATQLEALGAADPPAVAQRPAAVDKNPEGRSARDAATRALVEQASQYDAAATTTLESLAPLTEATDQTLAASVALVQSAHEKALTFDVPSLASTDTVSAYQSAVEAMNEPDPSGDLVALMQAYEDTWHKVVVSNEAGVRARGDSAVTPTYLRGVLIVNKTYPLPQDYGDGLTAETQKAFSKMQSAAAKKGLNIYISSGFRSYWSQSSIYNGIASRQGAAVADLDTARPGFSEHQSGLTFDLNSITESFAYTAEGKWVRDNAHKYGFVIRYPEGKSEITGYIWEPWHLRYLGVELATELYTSGQTLEEYLGVTSSYTQ